MLYFEAAIQLKAVQEENHENLKYTLRSMELANKFTVESEKGAICYPVNIQPGSLTIVCGVTPGYLKNHPMESIIRKYLQFAGVEGLVSSNHEITASACERLLRAAHKESFIESSCEAGETLFFESDHRLKINEELSVQELTYEQAIDRAKEIAFGRPLSEEIDRIFAKPEGQKIWGHPAHYMVISGSKNIRDKTISLLADIQISKL